MYNRVLYTKHLNFRIKKLTGTQTTILLVIMLTFALGIIALEKCFRNNPYK